jgi:hypothetical protein
MKLMIAAVALPLLCLGAGYGAGLALAPASPEVPHDLAEATDAGHAEEAGHTAADTAEDAQSEHGAEIVEAPQDGRELAEDRTIIRLGQITIPVEKPNSISYVVADFALKIESFELAERYKRVEEATRVRDSLLTAMHMAAESSVLRGVSIDSDALATLIRDQLSKDYAGIDDVLFVSLYKQDMARL